MGGHMSIRNETNDYYSYCVKYHPDWEGIVSSGVIHPYSTHEVSQREILSTVYIKYGIHTAVVCRDSPDLQRLYNGIFHPVFTIQPFENIIRLCCNRGGDEPMCRNQGEIPSALCRHHGSVRSRWPHMSVCCGCDGQHAYYHPKENEAKRELNGSLEKASVNGYGCAVCRQTSDVSAGPKDVLWCSDQERMLRRNVKSLWSRL